MAEKPSPQQYADSLRDQIVQVRRLSELYAESEDARLAAQREILQLEEQALAIEHNIAKTKEQQAKIDEQIAENQHQQALNAKRTHELDKRRTEDAKVRADKAREENSESAKLARLSEKIGAHWQAAAAVLVGIVGTIHAANEAMERGFSQRNMFSNLPFQIDTARTATKGLVQDTELARLAIESQRLAVTKSESEFEKLTWAASRLGLSVGRDATTSVENLVGALGRGETELLDNLGIFLRAGEAQRIYAERLGTTRNALTEAQKAEAFRVIGLERAIAAAEKVTISVTDSEQAWIDARQTYAELERETLPAVADALVPVWQGLAKLGEIAKQVLPVVGTYLAGVGKMVQLTGKLLSPLIDAGLAAWRALGMLAEVARSVASGLGGIKDYLADSWVGDAAGWFRDLAVSVLDFADNALDRMRAAAEENIPFVKSLTAEWDALKNTLLGPDDVGKLGAAKAMDELNGLIAKGAALGNKAKAAEAEKLAVIESEIEALDHEVKLGEAQGKSAKSLEHLLLRQYDLRVQLLTAQGDEKKLQEAIYAEEVRREKVKRGSGKGPSEADRIRAEGMATVEWLQAEVQYAEQIARLRGSEKQDAGEIARLRLEAADAALELELEVLAATRAKNSVERQTLQNKIDETERERELLSLRFEADERAAARDLAGKAADDIRKRMELERRHYDQQAEDIGNLIKLDDYRYRRNEQAIKHETELAMLAARSDMERLDLQASAEQRIHANRVAQINAEHAAALKVFELREAELALMDASDPAAAAKREDEARQLLHDREVERLTYEMELRQRLDAEEQRISQAQQARRLQAITDVESGLTTLQGLYGQAEQFASFFLTWQGEQQQEALDRTVAQMEARGRAQQAQIEAELEAAKGNAALQQQIRRRGQKQQEELDRKILKAKEEHADKQKRIETRMAGIKLLIDAAVYGVQAAGAYASYNIPQGLLYTAAAVLAGVQGTMLLAGNVPKAGGGSSSGAGAGGGDGAGGFSGGGGDEANRIPGSDPGKAAGMATSGASSHAMGGGGTVINIQNLNATGAIDDETGEKIARSLKRVNNSRET